MKSDRSESRLGVLLAFSCLFLATAPFTDATAVSTLEPIKAFGVPAPGANPRAELIQGTDGALYGTAEHGGYGIAGTVFKLNPDGTGLTVLWNFTNPTDGGSPTAGLIQGTDGALYGVAYRGGSSDAGTVFKLNPDGTGFTVLKTLVPSATGANPFGSLIQGTDGALYGTASYGGSSNAGTLFKLNTDGTGFTVLKYFDNGADGGYPYTRLIQGTDGALYGTASQGGTSGAGTVFKMNTDGTGFAVLQNFDYSTTGGSLPSKSRRKTVPRPASPP